MTGSPLVRRTGYVMFAREPCARAGAAGREIFTRDLGLAAILVRLPRLVRAPVVYEAHTIAADEAAARHEMLTGAPPASPAKLRRLANRDALVWRAADGYVTITAGLKAEEARAPVPAPEAALPSSRTARDSSFRLPASSLPPASTLRHSPSDMPVTCIRGRASRSCRRSRGGSNRHARADHRRPRAGAGSRARVKKVAADLDCASRVTFTGLLAPPEVGARLREVDVLVLPNPAKRRSRTPSRRR